MLITHFLLPSSLPTPLTLTLSLSLPPSVYSTLRSRDLEKGAWLAKDLPSVIPTAYNAPEVLIEKALHAYPSYPL